MNDPRTDVGQILVAVDGSPASLEALRHAHRMATLLGDELVAVTAWQPFRRLVLPPPTAHPQEAAEQLLAASVIEAFRGQVTPLVRTMVVEGDPADCLVKLSRDADLLVVGSRGHSGLAGAVLGSVSAHCAAHAHCSVLVVHAPPGAAAAEDAEAAVESPDPAERIVVTY
ncbi:Nucleotide-binding universal stress protein, UspA family [Nakamurella panacisegetis]|uniref:Nucleotide-binding universal stress protein, UspA family n=1 Tax=Nakamurella panacisegetis TaxID=1090615 RepID=A0A1H0SAV1_9ACTN|nr:universal stress protein [Nakamurella panacisegetis]SDP38649.1 Nucleotide-binding universal stress protein, UspA family [Nakamurella panacisegetis]